MRQNTSEDPLIVVLGGGSFGTALSHIIASNGSRVYLWMRDSEHAAQTQQSRINKRYLPDFVLDEKVVVTSDIEMARHCHQIFVSVPSASFRSVVQQVAPLVSADVQIISTTKGIDQTGFTLMSEILREELPQNPIGVLSGPNFAKEMLQNQLTASVIASEHNALIENVQQLLCSGTFRVYSNDDCPGVELAGALKNIYAIMVGMAQARHCGHNTLAMLMTRALAEMGRFSHRLGANPMTFLGLAGVGDLILTCSSDMSRNYRLGYALGCGKSYEQAVADIGQVVEGVNTLRLVKHKADEMDIYMPLVSALYALMFDQQPVDSIIKQLMSSENSHDVDFNGA